MCRYAVRIIPKCCPDVAGISVRMRPKYAYKRVEIPIYSYGEYLRLKKYPDAICKVDDIRWHSDRSEPFYTLIIDGNKKSKRYYSDEFLLE